MEIIEGKIYAFSKDRKSISVNGVWLHNFVPLKEDIVKNQDYKITYTIKKTDDKEFFNIKSIVPIRPEPKTLLITREIQPKKDIYLNDRQREMLDENRDWKLDIPIQTKNTILMNVKDLIVCDLNKDIEFTESELSNKIKRLTKDFVDAYKLIV